MRVKSRIATSKETSRRLFLQNYNPETCTGVCLVISTDPDDGGFSLVRGINHKCGRELKQKQEIKWVDDWCEPVGEMPPITKEDLEPQTKEDDSATL